MKKDYRPIIKKIGDASRVIIGLRQFTRLKYNIYYSNYPVFFYKLFTSFFPQPYAKADCNIIVSNFISCWE